MTDNMPDNMPDDMNDQRQHPRVAVPTIALKVSDGERFRQRYLRDLSEGGVYVRTQRTFEPGTEVRLLLTPPGADQPLLLAGSVARVDLGQDQKPVGMGITFAKRDAETMARIKELVSAYLPEQDAGASRELRDEVALLRARLRAADEHVQSLVSDLEGYEADDEANRKLIEKLLAQKAELEHQTSAERTRIDSLETELESTRAELATEREHAQEALSRLKNLEARYDKLQTKTEHLRELVSIVMEDRDLAASIEEMQGDEGATENAREEAVETRVAAVAADVLVIDSDSAIEVAVEDGGESAEFTSAERGRIAPSVDDVEILPAGDPMELIEPSVFAVRLESGFQLLPTDKMRDFMPQGRVQELVVELVAKHHSLGDICDHKPRTLRQRTVLDTLYVFYLQGMVTLRQEC